MGNETFYWDGLSGGNLCNENDRQKACFELWTGDVLFDIKRASAYQLKALFNVRFSFSKHTDTEHHKIKLFKRSM